MTTLNQIAAALNKAADRLEKPNAWCQNTMAKSEDGIHVAPNDQDACQWCSLGALQVATSDRTTRFYAQDALAKAINTESIAAWNDNPARAQEEVVEAFRAAAKQVQN